MSEEKKGTSPREGENPLCKQMLFLCCQEVTLQQARVPDSIDRVIQSHLGCVEPAFFRLHFLPGLPSHMLISSFRAHSPKTKGLHKGCAPHAGGSAASMGLSPFQI